MEMTYSEPQTPLFPPSYVNLVNKKDHCRALQCDHFSRICDWKLLRATMKKYLGAPVRAVQLIEFDSHAHLVSKAGSVIGTKSPSPVFKLSGS